MTEDQYQRLSALHDRLFEVVMVDADPDNWCANGKTPVDMTRDERGDAQWSRKIAAGTLAIFGRVNWVLSQNFGAGQPDGPKQGSDREAELDAKAQDDLDAEVRAAEREAMRALNRAAGKSPSDKKAEFREHGRE